MALRSLKAECEEHESRTDALHAKMDKLSDESPEGASEGKAPPFLRRSVIATFVVAAALIIAGLWLLTREDLSNDVVGTDPPVIDSSAFLSGPNGMTIWVNASDPDDSIVNITVQVSARSQGNDSYAWPPVLQKVYWVNESSAAITDVLIFGALPEGDYRISAFATDASGRTSDTAGNVEFSL